MSNPAKSVSSKKLAVFDIDGTLTHTARLTYGYFADSLRRHVGDFELSLDWDGCEDVTDTGIVAGVFRQFLGRDPEDDEWEDIRTRYFTTMEEGCQKADAVAGAAETLRALREHPEWEVAIATGNWRTAAHHKLTICDLPHTDLPMGTSNDSPARARILEAAIRRAPDAARVLYIGDRDWDHRAARTLGVGFVARGRHVSDPPFAVPDYSNFDRVLDTFERALKPSPVG